MTTTGADPTNRARIVVGVDGSPPSVEALRWAARIAPALHADVEAVTVWIYPATYGLAPIPIWSPRSDAEKILQMALDRAFGPDRPATLTTRAAEGLPARTLVEASQSADLLLVGSRGLGGFKGLLLGSVSSACTEHAKCPVLVIRGQAAGGEATEQSDASDEDMVTERVRERVDTVTDQLRLPPVAVCVLQTLKAVLPEDRRDVATLLESDLAAV
jgi:nucleotide-binding universal stress UspA family protein